MHVAAAALAALIALISPLHAGIQLLASSSELKLAPADVLRRRCEEEQVAASRREVPDDRLPFDPFYAEKNGALGAMVDSEMLRGSETRQHRGAYYRHSRTIETPEAIKTSVASPAILAAESRDWCRAFSLMEGGDDVNAYPTVLSERVAANVPVPAHHVRSNADYVLLLAAFAGDHAVVRYVAEKCAPVSEGALAHAIAAPFLTQRPSLDSVAMLADAGVPDAAFGSAMAMIFDRVVRAERLDHLVLLARKTAARGLTEFTLASLAAVPGLYEVPRETLAADATEEMERRYPMLSVTVVWSFVKGQHRRDLRSLEEWFVEAALKNHWRVVRTLLENGFPRGIAPCIRTLSITYPFMSYVAAVPGAISGLVVLAVAANRGDIVVLRYLLDRAGMLGVDLRAVGHVLPAVAMHGGAPDAALWMLDELCPPERRADAEHAVLQEALRGRHYSVAAALMQRSERTLGAAGPRRIAALVLRSLNTMDRMASHIALSIGFGPTDMEHVCHRAIRDSLAAQDFVLPGRLAGIARTYATKHVSGLAIRVRSAVYRNSPLDAATALELAKLSDEERELIVGNTMDVIAEQGHMAVVPALQPLVRDWDAFAVERAWLWMYRAAQSGSYEIMQRMLDLVPESARAMTLADATRMIVAARQAAGTLQLLKAAVGDAGAVRAEHIVPLLTHALIASMDTVSYGLVREVAAICQSRLSALELRAAVLAAVGSWCGEERGDAVPALVAFAGFDLQLQQDVLRLAVRAFLRAKRCTVTLDVEGLPGWDADVMCAELRDIASAAAAANNDVVLRRTMALCDIAQEECVRWTVGPLTVGIAFHGIDMDGLIAMQRAAATTDDGANFVSVTMAIDHMVREHALLDPHRAAHVGQSVELRREFERSRAPPADTTA